MGIIELRKCFHNPRRITIISVARGRRPHYTKPSTGMENISFCPFCPGNEGQTPPAVLALTRLNYSEYVFVMEKQSGEIKDWIVRVFPNKYPALMPKPDLNMAYGYHEVLVESRIHSEEKYLRDVRNIYLALKTLMERVKQILRDPKIKHITVIKNKGVRAGASVNHPHIQIFANTFIPPELKEEIRGFKRYFRENGKCPLCYTVSSLSELVFYTNDSFASLVAYAPRVPYEVHIIPLKHAPNFLEISDDEVYGLSLSLSATLLALRSVLGDFDYNFWFHTVYDSSLETFHWHIEIIPLTTTWGGYEKGSGIYVVDRFPEDVASELRKTTS